MKIRKIEQSSLIQNWSAQDLEGIVCDVTNSKIPYKQDAQIADNFKVAVFMHLYREVL